MDKPTNFDPEHWYFAHGRHATAADLDRQRQRVADAGVEIALYADDLRARARVTRDPHDIRAWQLFARRHVQ